MSVIINDFEVVVEPPSPDEADTPETEAPQPAPALSPMDLDDLLDRRAQRQARLRAH